MTASITSAEKGKPPGVGRCLIATGDSPLRQPRRIPDSNSPAVATCLATSSPRRGTGGHVVERVCSDVTASFILSLTLRHEPVSQAPREGSDVRPGIGFVHGNNHGASHAREAVNPCRDLGNVCRA